jgi:hypothetical protein
MSLRALGLTALVLLSACGGQQGGTPSSVEGKTPDGTVTMRQVQVAYIGSGSTGGGTLYYRGRAYPFTVGGLGVGGIGASTIEAEGEVYSLPDVAQFPGEYAQVRYGFALGQASAGDLWMKNQSGVVMHLKAKRTGLMLSLGADVVRIAMRP